MGKQWKLWQSLFSWVQKSLQMVTKAIKLKDTLKKIYDKPRQHNKKQRHYFANKGPSCQNYCFSSNQVWMWVLDHKESWVSKNWLIGRPGCWERLKAGGEGDNRGWDGWMASPTYWTWVWASKPRELVMDCLESCSPWGCKESDTTERLNWSERRNSGSNIFFEMGILAMFMAMKNSFLHT